MDSNRPHHLLSLSGVNGVLSERSPLEVPLRTISQNRAPRFNTRGGVAVSVNSVNPLHRPDMMFEVSRVLPPPLGLMDTDPVITEELERKEAKEEEVEDEMEDVPQTEPVESE